MKSICKIFLLALSVYISVCAQITEIIRLPVQDISQSIKESATDCNKKLKPILNELENTYRYKVNFCATAIASGVYIYQLRVNDYISSKKMVLIR
jgi:hypothetical protein